MTSWAAKDNLLVPDAENNQLIDRLNARMKNVALELGVEVMDFHNIMKGNPHEDYIHFVQSAYNKPSSMIVDWFTAAK